ncbi:hypothetical protein PHYC_03157 [Phycisphaerales bacterium]|nr:hypothetical protein PHYC_03157 [Phycisphaerales bacterium]
MRRSILAGVGSLSAAFAACAGAQTFSNSAPITVPASGAASPYPSTIDVSGITGNISAVFVTLYGCQHTFTEDLDILVVGPTGARVLLMSDVGGSGDLNSVNLTFAFGAPSMPTATANIPSGTYSPTNFLGGDTFPGPAPAPPYSSGMTAFTGSDPNGPWSLYVLDDSSPSGGSISGGWTISINSQPPSPLSPSFTYQGVLKGPSGPITSPVDLRLAVWDHEDSPLLPNRLALVTRSNITPGAGGDVTTTVTVPGGTFGPDQRWLEIEVRSPAGTGTWTTLTPRQRITPAPVALYALSAGAPWVQGQNGISFWGNVGIRVIEPTALLDLGGTPGVDGIRFPDNSLQTTAYPSSIRITGTVDFPMIFSGLASNATVSVPGAAIGDSVIINPREVMAPGLVIRHVFVSAADTVRLDVLNAGSVPIDPTPADYDITVFK